MPKMRGSGWSTGACWYETGDRAALERRSFMLRGRLPRLMETSQASTELLLES
jgi:hypothetical protein